MFQLVVPIYAYLPMSLSLFTHRNFSGGVEVRIGKNEHDPNDEANVLQTVRRISKLSFSIPH